MIRPLLFGVAAALALTVSAGAQDRETARAAAETGDLGAAYDLGRMYRDGIDGTSNPMEARAWFKRAMDKGHAAATTAYALMVATGAGGDADRDAAHRLLLLAAARGDDQGPYALGVLREEGPGETGGPGKSAAGAAFWFRIAGLRGHVDAMFNLGRLYMAGQGVPSDAATAYVWFLRAAKAGDAQAQLIVAMILASGQGAPADPKEALVWYYRAKSAGQVDDALEVRLMKALSEAEVADAQARAATPLN
jgi:TPR repeat protein